MKRIITNNDGSTNSQHFTYDNIKLIADHQNEYFYNTAVNQPIGMQTATDNTYYHFLTDEKGSVFAVLNDDSIKLQFTYSAWGHKQITDKDTTDSLTDIPFGYNGMLIDTPLSIPKGAYIRPYYDLHFRDYDPDTAQFDAYDPSGMPDGMNRYAAYFGVNGVDPDGLQSNMIYNPKLGVQGSIGVWNLGNMQQGNLDNLVGGDFFEKEILNKHLYKSSVNAVATMAALAVFRAGPKGLNLLKKFTPSNYIARFMKSKFLQTTAGKVSFDGGLAFGINTAFNYSFGDGEHKFKPGEGAAAFVMGASPHLSPLKLLFIMASAPTAGQGIDLYFDKREELNPHEAITDSGLGLLTLPVGSEITKKLGGSLFKNFKARNLTLPVNKARSALKEFKNSKRLLYSIKQIKKMPNFKKQMIELRRLRSIGIDTVYGPEFEFYVMLLAWPVV